MKFDNARIKMQNGYYSNTRIEIFRSGWVYVGEVDRYFPPTQVRYIERQTDE